VLANAFPVLFRKMKEHSSAGNYGKASAEQFRILDINGPMYEEGNPVGVKHVMSLLEMCQPFVRLPLVPASFALQKKIEKFYEEIKK
jgi:4-hydroxy-tetrahydrodipicolinate synthase